MPAVGRPHTQFVVLVTAMAHWLACMWVLIGRMGPKRPEGAAELDPHMAFGYNWIDKAGMLEATPIQLYGVGLYTAFTLLFSGSGGTV